MIQGRTQRSSEHLWESGADRARPVLRFLSRAIAVLVVLAAISAGLVVLREPLAQREKLRIEIGALESERDLAEADRDRAAQVVEWIEHDPEYLEVVARDYLDLYRAGETVFRIDPVRVSAPAPVPGADPQDR